MLNEREKLIGARLRAFRETLQIPRARFAVSIGFGSERLASIEAGRAPLRYEVFHAVSRRYHINPSWLITGDQSPQWHGPIDELKDISPRALFSEVYDTLLAPKLAQSASEAGGWISEMTARLEKLLNILEDPEKERHIPTPVIEAICQSIHKVKTRVDRDLKLRLGAKTRMDRKRKGHPAMRRAEALRRRIASTNKIIKAAMGKHKPSSPVKASK